MSNDQSDLEKIWDVINNIQHRLSVVENDLKWIKWLLGIEVPLMIGLIIGVARLIIG